MGIIHELGVKSVEIEASEKQLQNSRLDPNILFFWRTVTSECQAYGIKVVFLLPDAAAEKISSKAFEVPTYKLHFELANPKIKGLIPALIKDSMTRIMEKKALREKPEAIVSGGGHTLVMQKDLGVPSKKVRFTRPEKQEYFLDIAQGVRRFRLKRKIRKGAKRIQRKARNLWARKK